MWSKTLDAPGLVAIGIGGRRRRVVRKMRNLFVKLVWNRWVGAAVGGGVSAAIGKLIVAQVMGS
jgi:hypothetical protein